MAQNIKRIKEEVLGILLVLFSIYVALSLFSYTKWDPSFFTAGSSTTRNYGGLVGSYMADTIISLVGLTSYLLPFCLIIYGIKRLLGKDKRREILIGTILLLIATPILMSLIVKTFGLRSPFHPGGLLGYETSNLLVRFLSLPGAYIFSLSIFFSSLIIMSPVPTSDFIGKILSRKPGGSPPKRKIKVVEEHHTSLKDEDTFREPRSEEHTSELQSH